jgi:hypothetical protein
MIKLLVE